MTGVYRTELSINVECNKCKREALQCITQVIGIDMVQVNTKDHKIIVEGEADPTSFTNELKKKFKCTRIITSGPKPPPKKDEPNKEEKKNGKSGKNGKKEPDKEPPLANPGHPPPITCHPIHPPLCIPYDPCRPYDWCRPIHSCGCSACSGRSDILWPTFHPPRASPDETLYVWNEGSQNYCTIC